jgi:hypothetical protein
MPRPLSTPGKDRYPLYRRLGEPQDPSGQVRKISPPTGIRSPDRPARCQSPERIIHNTKFVKYNTVVYRRVVDLSKFLSK